MCIPKSKSTNLDNDLKKIRKSFQLKINNVNIQVHKVSDSKFNVYFTSDYSIDDKSISEISSRIVKFKQDNPNYKIDCFYSNSPGMIISGIKESKSVLLEISNI